MSRDDPPDPPTRASHGAGPSASPGCFKCHEPPAAGTKLRVCAKCLHTSYCNADCQWADWASHKLDCKALGEMHQRGLAIAAAHKAARRPKKIDENGLWEWYEEACPGLAKAVELVAWRHRRESPVILVQSCSDGTDASAPSLKMMPRSKWEMERSWRTGASRLCALFSTGLDSTLKGATWYSSTLTTRQGRGG